MSFPILLNNATTDGIWESLESKPRILWLAEVPFLTLLDWCYCAVKTCGLPKITSVMRNQTLDPGETAR